MVQTVSSTIRHNSGSGVVALFGIHSPFTNLKILKQNEATVCSETRLSNLIMKNPSPVIESDNAFAIRDIFKS